MITRSKKTRVVSEGSESEEVEPVQNIALPNVQHIHDSDLPSNSSIGNKTPYVDFDDRGIRLLLLVKLI